jgi:MurNAc alpha-1-phosphate uridylyltransferase
VADSGALARLVLVPNPTQHPHGDFGLDGEQVVERQTGRFTYSGVGVYRPEFFEGCTAGKFPLLPLLKRAIAAGRLRGQLHEGEWCDVGTPQRLAELDERVGAQRRQAK